jgi:hypothetical protein
MLGHSLTGLWDCRLFSQAFDQAFKLSDATIKVMSSLTDFVGTVFQVFVVGDMPNAIVEALLNH